MPFWEPTAARNTEAPHLSEMVTRVLDQQPAIMSLFLSISIPVEDVLEQVLAGTLAFLLRSAAKYAAWAGSAPPLDTEKIVTAASAESDTAACDESVSAENEAVLSASAVICDYAEANAVPPTIPAVTYAALARIVELQPQILQLLKSYKVSEEKAKQREVGYKEQIKTLTSKLKQAEAREFAEKFEHTLQLISSKNELKSSGFPPPAKYPKHQRQGHRSGHGARKRRQIKRDHTRQATSGPHNTAHGSKMVRNLIPPAQIPKPPLIGLLNRSEDASLWNNYYAARQKAEEAMNKSEDNISHSFTKEECLELHKPPPQWRSESPNSTWSNSTWTRSSSLAAQALQLQSCRSSPATYSHEHSWF